MGTPSVPKLVPISVTQHAHTTIIVYKETGDAFLLRIATSADGIHFKLNPKPVVVARTMKNENLADCDHFRLSVVHDTYILSYEKKTGTTKTGIKKEIVFAHSKDLLKFRVHKNPASRGENTTPNHSGHIVKLGHTNDRVKKYALYYGWPTITVAESTDLEKWKTTGALLISPRSGFFDHGQISIVSAHSVPEGIAVLYQTHAYENGKEQLLVGGALFAHDNPKKILWRSEGALWEHEYEKSSTTGEAWKACGVIFKKDSLFIYLASNEGDLSVVAIPNRFHLIGIGGKKRVTVSHVTRHSANPIIKPSAQHDWQSQATFNPAAIQLDGRIHLLYRAMGSDGVSRVGHSSSADGANFDRCTPGPAFEPSAGFGMPADGLDANDSTELRRHDPTLYTSGGGWAGCEDPRAVVIGKRIYLTYVAFEGWNSVRIALTSISVADFKKEYWNWAPPALISPPGEIHKNWVLFPEKINGKYAILHSVSPRVKIDYLDSLKNVSIKSSAPSGGRKYHWDSKVRGAGPPPIKTNIGWLLLYHADDMLDPHKYKIGAMILDPKDPAIIRYRSPEAILTPEMQYENDWKPGVVYASGAIVKDGNLLVYYGGGDKYVCLAETPLKKLLTWMVTYGKVS